MKPSFLPESGSCIRNNAVNRYARHLVALHQRLAGIRMFPRCVRLALEKIGIRSARQRVEVATIRQEQRDQSFETIHPADDARSKAIEDLARDEGWALVCGDRCCFLTWIPPKPCCQVGLTAGGISHGYSPFKPVFSGIAKRVEGRGE